LVVRGRGGYACAIVILEDFKLVRYERREEMASDSDFSNVE